MSGRALSAGAAFAGFGGRVLTGTALPGAIGAVTGIADSGWQRGGRFTLLCQVTVLFRKEGRKGKSMVSVKQVCKDAKENLNGFRAAFSLKELLFLLLGSGGGALQCLALFGFHVAIFVCLVTGLSLLRWSSQQLGRMFVWVWVTVLFAIARTFIGAWIKLANNMAYYSVAFSEILSTPVARSASHAFGQVCIDAWRTVGALLLFPFGIYPAVLFLSVYSCADIIYASMPERGIIHALRNSRKTTRTNKRKIAAVYIRFFGGFLLCLLTLGLGWLYVSPYYHETKVELYLQICEENRLSAPMPRKDNSIDYLFRQVN